MGSASRPYDVREGQAVLPEYRESSSRRESASVD